MTGWVFSIARNQWERWADGKVIETISMFRVIHDRKKPQ